MSSSDNEVDMMRRALGLRGPATSSDATPQPNIGSHGPRHDMERRTRRFVRDGEVPVVVLGRTRDAGSPVPAPNNRLVAAESALHGERAARERAERSLQEAQESIQHMQTQLGHANLAHAEALAAERQAREVAERSLELAERNLTDAIAAREALEARVAAIPDAFVPAVPKPQPILPAVVRKARAKAQTQVRSAQPVKWWLATGKGAARKS